MELQQLRYLVAVAEEASFTAAARREHVAQPAVSAAIKALEHELGVPLFRRGRTGARPTEAGLAVLAHARAALSAVAAARHVAEEVTELLRGQITVGMVIGCASTVLADLLADLATSHPGVDITLVEGHSTDLLAALATGSLDLAWVGRADPPPPGVETEVVYAEEQVAVLPVGSPVPGPTLAVADLAHHRLIALPTGTGGRAALEAACAAQGVRPDVAYEATGLEMVLLLAQRGLGTGIVPASVAAAFTGHVRPIPLHPQVLSRIELAWRADGPTSPAGTALVTAARHHITEAATPTSSSSAPVTSQ